MVRDHSEKARRLCDGGSWAEETGNIGRRACRRSAACRPGVPSRRIAALGRRAAMPRAGRRRSRWGRAGARRRSIGPGGRPGAGSAPFGRRRRRSTPLGSKPTALLFGGAGSRRRGGAARAPRSATGIWERIGNKTRAGRAAPAGSSAGRGDEGAAGRCRRVAQASARGTAPRRASPRRGPSIGLAGFTACLPVRPRRVAAGGGRWTWGDASRRAPGSATARQRAQRGQQATQRQQGHHHAHRDHEQPVRHAPSRQRRQGRG